MIDSTAAIGTVFVIQRARPRTSDGWEPNLEPATRYGKLDFIFDPGDRVYSDPATAAKKAATRLAAFDPETDYLLWPNQGDPACVWVTIMHLCLLGHRKLRFLYWSRGRAATGGMTNENGYYLPVEIDLSAETP